MRKRLGRIILLSCSFIIWAVHVQGQSFDWIGSTEGNTWQQSKIKLQPEAKKTPALEAVRTGEGLVFKAWGTCFNELGWDALNLLARPQQEIVLKKLFAPDGDLKFTLGRFSMNANDYARDWYSCDEVDGDFQLKYFNIDRDKTTLIPYIKAARQYNPGMRFWISPWSPPSWMKVNHYYSVRGSDRFNKMPPESEVALFEDNTEKNNDVFPQQLAVRDYFIRDPRMPETIQGVGFISYFC